MFTVAVRREFIAQHFLIGGDWGAENQRHSHHYLLECELQGETLDEHNYLTDIVEIEKALEELIAIYRDQTLNALPPFQGQNPSLEFFSRLLCHQLAERLHAPKLRRLTLRLWENANAWASYQMDFGSTAG